MKLGDARVWLGLFSAAGVSWLAMRDLQESGSPGRLATVHQRIDELADRDGCTACHGDGDVDMATACLECHEAVEGHLASGHGIHGSMDDRVVRACALCHSEHHGEDFLLVNARSFAVAGAPTPDDFYHGFVGFEMGGKHLELSCEECHANAWTPNLPEGEHRFLGLSRDCAKCHDEPHEVPLDRLCSDCHGQVAFAELTPFEHDAEFPLVGAHGEVSCTDCHVPDESHSIDAVAARHTPAPPPRLCADCHENPHSLTFIDALAVGVAPQAVCVDCHDPTHDGFDDPIVAESLAPLQHAASNFRLEGPHAERACADCHDPEVDDFAARHPGREQDGCVSCHTDPHEGQFEGATCLDCHDRDHFDPHTFTLARHLESALPLEGAHLALECASCHEDPRGEAPRRFANTPNRCEACHDDAHEGAFDQHDVLAERVDGTCASCHGHESFHELPAPFDHGGWTGFALVGAHLQANCEGCHETLPEANEFGRTFGHATEPTEGCAACHGDPHEGAFDGPEAPKSEEQGCLRCHAESSWRHFPVEFDHLAWTTFPLEDAHLDANCGSCHTPKPTDELGRSFCRARGRDCADCHDNPHAGQFEEEGQTNCTRCHESTAEFAELIFDHNQDSSFEIDAAHIDLDCAACHREWADTGIVRYKPLGKTCVECHGTHPGQEDKGEGL